MADEFPNPPVSDVKEWLAGQLGDSAELAAVIGQGKVFPRFVPGIAYLPAVTYKRLSTSRAYHTKGQGESVTGMFEVRIVAESSREGEKVICRASRVIGNLLSGLQTVANDSQGGQHKISSVSIANEADEEGAVQIDKGTDGMTFETVFMVQIKYDEPARGN